MQCIAKLASPNCLFLGILPVSIFIWALFNCLVVILNLFIFDLLQACRNVTLALEDLLTNDSFSERLTSLIAACKIFPRDVEICLQLHQFQPNPCRWEFKPGGKSGDCRAGPMCGGEHHPGLCFPPISRTLRSGSSTPCTDHFSAWGLLQMQKLETPSIRELLRLWEGDCVVWACLIGKNPEKGSLRNTTIARAAFSSHEMSVMGTPLTISHGERKSTLFTSHQPPDFQSGFRACLRREEVWASGGRVK